MRARPSNHCSSILEVLTAPIPENPVILDLPLLQDFHISSFVAIGETIDFIRQILKVRLQAVWYRLNYFLHKSFLGIAIHAFIPRFSSVGFPLPYENQYTDLLQRDIKYNVTMDGTHLSLPQIHPYHARKQRDGVTWAHFSSRPVRLRFKYLY